MTTGENFVTVNHGGTPCRSFLSAFHTGDPHMKHDLLHIQGKPFVLVPLHEYREMTQAPDTGDAVLPDTVLDALAAQQESPMRILRRHRGLTQQQLADAAGMSRPYLTEMEKGRKSGLTCVSLRAVARKRWQSTCATSPAHNRGAHGPRTDILIAGAGAPGLTLGILLAQAGLGGHHH